MTALPPRQTLRIEFKSDRAPLPDRDLLEAIVCLANTEGGHLYLGVEDDGRVTGIHKRRRDVTMLAAMTGPLPPSASGSSPKRSPGPPSR